jgi:hypothetical protein
MKNIQKRPPGFYLHPLLFAIYPVLAVLAANLDQVRAQSALRAGLASLAAGLLTYGFWWLVLRKPGRAALISSFWLILLFSYGHVYQLIEGKALLGVVVGKHRVLAAVYLGMLALGTWALLKRVRSARPLNRIATLVAAALLVFPLYQIGAFEYRFQRLANNGAATNAGATNGGAAASVSSAPSAGTGSDAGPDVYYILLDGYSRADVMQKLYGLDINPFMDELRSIGFVLPECAQSNYGITAFSMYASLNMQYLDAHVPPFPLGSPQERVDYQTMRETLRHNQVRQYLHDQGYKFITFETGFWWLDIDDADLYIVENNNPLKKYSGVYAVSNFEQMFVRTTALRLLTEANTAYLAPITRKINTPEEQHYDWVKFAIDQLDQIPSIPGKKFVYFHVLAPHDPFVFAADGSFTTVKVAADGSYSDVPYYPDEVTYLNRRMLEIVRSLIAKSKTPPIIIIQGDHGWDPRYRMQIFNAYYLPGGGDKLVYPRITPVNTFRLILDRYFGGHFGLLKDQSYFSMGADFPQYGVLSRPYQLTPVPDTCMGNLP